MTAPVAPNDVQAAFCAVLVDEWARGGVRRAVVAPGSRSTPLLVALAEAADRREIVLDVVLDERGAGFFALGHALATGSPALVVTTSGTAAVELHPAVVEAHHSGVPLVAVTADRPEELHGCGAPQTVEQVGLFGPATRWAASVPVADLATAHWWRPLASRALAEAMGGAHRPGPVHLNLAFREPLLGSAAKVAGTGPGPAAALAGRQGRAPWHQVLVPEELPVPEEAVRLLAGAGERGLVVVGGGGPGPGALQRLTDATGWPVLASPLSNVRSPGSVAFADALLRCSPVRDWHPDVVLRMGAPWASRVVNEWLAGLSCPQVLVDPVGAWAAPDRLPGHVVVAGPDALCLAVAAAVTGGRRGEWARRWSSAEAAAEAAVDAAMGPGDELTEPGVAREVMRSLVDGATLVLSSSMPVRDFEWWTRPRHGARVVSNRGANGIDGVLSTALGVAAGSAQEHGGSPAPVVAVLGDLAFVYDAGALLWAQGRALSLDVIVVDNDGGGIFNFLPQAASQHGERCERLWGTPHGLDLTALATAFGAQARRLRDLGQLSSAVASPPAPGVRVWVVPTQRAANVKAHRRLLGAVEAAVAGLSPSGG